MHITTSSINAGDDDEKDFTSNDIFKNPLSKVFAFKPWNPFFVPEIPIKEYYGEKICLYFVFS
jgi:hypothetical protein